MTKLGGPETSSNQVSSRLTAVGKWLDVVTGHMVPTVYSRLLGEEAGDFPGGLVTFLQMLVALHLLTA